MNKLSRIACVGIIGLFALNIWTFLEIKSIDKEISSMQSQVGSLSNSVNSVSSNVNSSLFQGINEMRDLIKKQYEWVADANYKVIEVDNTGMNSRVMVMGSLKTLDKNASVYLMYATTKDDDSGETKVAGEWKKVSVENMKGLTISKELYLSNLNNYKIKILTESSNESRSNDFLDINLLDELDGRVSVGSYDGNIGDDLVQIKFDVYNEHKNIENYKLKNLKVRFGHDNKAFTDIDIYAEGKLVNQSSGVELKIIDIDGGLAESYKDGRSNFTYELKINRSVFKNTEFLGVEIYVEDFMGKKYQGLGGSLGSFSGPNSASNIEGVLR